MCVLKLCQRENFRGGGNLESRETARNHIFPLWDASSVIFEDDPQRQRHHDSDKPLAFCLSYVCSVSHPIVPCSDISTPLWAPLSPSQWAANRTSACKTDHLPCRSFLKHEIKCLNICFAMTCHFFSFSNFFSSLPCHSGGRERETYLIFALHRMAAGWPLSQWIYHWCTGFQWRASKCL